MEGLRSVAAWHEVIVVDDGSSDETSAVATRAGARVIRHPYNKGNGAAVKTGIRQASGEYVLIIDADGQHSAADAMRLVVFLGEYDLVVGARAGSGTGVNRAALRQSSAQLARQFSDRPANSGSHIGDARGAHQRTSRIPAPSAERIFDADHDDPVVREGGIQRSVRVDPRRRTARTLENQARVGRREISF